MKYSIIICPKSNNSIAIDQAYQFIEAILQDASLEQGHEIHVFFYGLAVKSAFQTSYDWRQIAKQGVKLNACSTIAESYQKKQLGPHFSITGIGQWMESTLNTDKHIEFV